MLNEKFLLKFSNPLVLVSLKHLQHLELISKSSAPANINVGEVDLAPPQDFASRTDAPVRTSTAASQADLASVRELTWEWNAFLLNSLCSSMRMALSSMERSVVLD